MVVYGVSTVELKSKGQYLYSYGNICSGCSLNHSRSATMIKAPIEPGSSNFDEPYLASVSRAA
jgi:hypothetical protein